MDTSDLQVSPGLVMIQPTPFCNISCKYCYLPERSNRNRITIETLSHIYRLVFQVAESQLTFLWHAGEPLVLPPAFYRQALDLQANYTPQQLEVSNAIQTNGTLINPAWCEFFKDYSVRIGVSLDGPDFLHNKNRVDRRGRGTHERVMEGIACLQEHKIDFHVLMVLSRESLNYPDEIWDFLRSNGIDKIAFNVEEVEGIHASTSMGADDAAARYSHFLNRLLQLRDAEPERVFLRELDALLNFIAHGSSSELRSTENTPFAILNFAWDGAISTFSPELLGMTHPNYENFIFGWASQLESLPDIVNTQQFVRVWGDIKGGVQRCRETCGYFPVCGGGAPSNKVFEKGTFDTTETLSCKLRVKTLTDVVLAYLEERHAPVKEMEI